MTILNVHLQEHRALIATNTDGIGPDGDRGTLSKLYSFPHANAVLCSQGQVALGVNVYIDCLIAMTDLDGMAQMFEGRARARFEALHEEVTRLNVAVNIDTVVALVGWSNLNQRMTFWHCSMSVKDGVKLTELDQSMVSPWPVELWGQPDDALSTEESMLAVARRQAHAHSAPEQACGGHLVVAEITKNLIVQKTIRAFAA